LRAVYESVTWKFMQQRKNSKVLFSVLESCHIYKDNYYISMKIAGSLLARRGRVSAMTPE
jgi:hypothetical protein